MLVIVSAEERPAAILGGSFAGIFAALAAGWLADKRSPVRLNRAGAAAVALAGCLTLPVAYSTAPGRMQVLLLVAGMAMIDAGLQIALVANQRLVQALEPAFRPRLAATLTVCGFAGSATGAAAQQLLWQAWGWQASIGLVALAGALALGLTLLPTSRQGARAFWQPLRLTPNPPALAHRLASPPMRVTSR